LPKEYLSHFFFDAIDELPTLLNERDHLRHEQYAYVEEYFNHLADEHYYHLELPDRYGVASP
jgi:hypothetical protein